MTDLRLTIDEPKNGATYTGNNPVRLKATLQGQPPAQLYYRWYSTGFMATKSDKKTRKNTDIYKTTLNEMSYSQLDFQTQLPLGSQVITLSAMDVGSDDPEDLPAAKTMLMAGGPPMTGIAAPCVVHVFYAEMLNQVPFKVSQGIQVRARAPLKWGKKEGDKYVMDADYHAINRLTYQWVFEPNAQGNNRTRVSLNPAAKDLIFEMKEETDKPSIPLVGLNNISGLQPGQYQLTLTVQDKDNTAIKHQVSSTIQVEG